MEKGYTFEQRYTSLTYKPVDDSFDYLSETKDEKETIPEVLDWVAFKNQYFSCVFIAEQNFEKATLESKMEQKGSGYMKNYQADMQTASIRQVRNRVISSSIRTESLQDSACKQ